MQLTGGQFTAASALFGNDIATFPDFPAEIRAPRGTTYGVSGFQVRFRSSDIYTPGDRVNALVAMNPAGFKTNIGDVEPGGIVIVNEDEFDKANLKKCGYEEGYNPLDDDELNRRYQIFKDPDEPADPRVAGRQRDGRQGRRPLPQHVRPGPRVLALRPARSTHTVAFLERVLRQAEEQARDRRDQHQGAQGGVLLRRDRRAVPARYQVAPAKLKAGKYRRDQRQRGDGSAASPRPPRPGKRSSTRATRSRPASDIMHGMARLKHFGVKTFQAEDEIAAVCAAIGASFAGDFGI